MTSNNSTPTYAAEDVDRYDQILIEQFRSFGLYDKMASGHLIVQRLPVTYQSHVPGHLIVTKYQASQDICALALAIRAADAAYAQNNNR